VGILALQGGRELRLERILEDGGGEGDTEDAAGRAEAVRELYLDADLERGRVRAHR
jgi:hypothetical protein